jgi:hypothetical protein
MKKIILSAEYEPVVWDVPIQILKMGAQTAIGADPGVEKQMEFRAVKRSRRARPGPAFISIRAVCRLADIAPWPGETEGKL